ncbi:MAG: hypothetical protein AB1679_34770 [Actinomycetota bacterium]
MATPPGPHLARLSDHFVDTRHALHRLAAHVLAPARKAVTGRIGLRPLPGGFGTPEFGDGQQLRVEGVSLVRRRDGRSDAVGITSLAAAAAFAGVTLSADPGIGSDPPPLGDVEGPLPVFPAAATALGDWYGFSAAVLEEFRAELKAEGRECSEVQLWPEHFDLGCNIEGVNFGSSPGDGYLAEPYVYVGPWNTEGLPDGDFWNAPFGAVLPYREILEAADQHDAALAFLRRGADLALQRAGEEP